MTITQPVDMTECRAAQFDAFAHPVRLHLLRLIAAYDGTLTVDELKELVGENDVGWHLQRMRNAGIVTRSKKRSPRGYYTYYTLHLEALTDMQNELDRLFHQHTQAAAEARRV